MGNDRTENGSGITWFGSLKGKLILFFLAVSLIPLIGVGWFTSIQAQGELSKQAFGKLVAVRNFKASQIKVYFDSVDQDIRLMAGLPVVQSAMLELGNLVKTYGAADIRRAGLLGRPDFDNTEKFHLYNLSHSKYHPLFRELINTKGYVDVFLVDLNGDIIYSYQKRYDFATNLVDGPFSDTHLGEVFRNLQHSNRAGEIRMSDFTSYPPAGNLSIGFVGTPIIEKDIGPIGVLIYALPLDPIGDLVREKAGLQDPIRTYLVGPDKKIRFEAGFYEQDTVDTEAVRKGLAGETNHDVIRNDQGEEIFSAFQPIQVAGVKWVLLSEEPKIDALAPATDLGILILVVTIITVVLVILVGLWVALRIANPIGHLTAVAQRVTGGDLQAQAVVESRDETGQLAEAFNTMTGQLRQFIDTLGEQVRERTAELALSMEVGQRATAIRDLDELLPTITEFIRDQFNLYYTHVYLVDDVNENLILRAGTGDVGRQLLARGHSLPIDFHSIVGRTAATGQSVVVPDTEHSEIHKPNPLLPETRSELAVPLIVEERVIGVLDMQDDKINTFTRSNLTVFEAMAIQLAISIDSARQWALTQEAQERAEKAIQQLTREAWTERLSASPRSSGFVYDLSRITSLLPDAFSLTPDPKNGFSVPLVVQDQTIGYLSVKTPQDRDLSEDERGLLQAVAQQLSQKAENLRLFEATQQRVRREQIARRIIDRVRASRNIEMALKVATEELNSALGTVRATIDLQVAPQSSPAVPPAEEKKPASASGEIAQATPPTNGKAQAGAVDLTGEPMGSEPSHNILDDGEESPRSE